MIIAVVAALSVLVMYFYNLENGRYGDHVETAWGLARFFTILTNCLIVVTFTVAAVRRDGIGSAWVAALTLAILLVGAVYHTLLAGITVFEGAGIWANQGLHTIVPIACLLWWIAFAPKRDLGFRDLPTFIVWPCVYIAYALARGDADGTYPYPFMDLAEKSATEVAVNLAGLMVVLLIGGVIFVLVARFSDR
jgi:hypothetical protein